MSKTIVLLSGPSCAGKTPLIKSLQRSYPELSFGRPVLYTSRDPRPQETEAEDYFFRSEEEIKQLSADRFVVAQTRHLWQAIDLDQVETLLQEHDLLIFDVHPTLVSEFTKQQRIQQRENLRLVRVFMQPATLEEIKALKRSKGYSSEQEAAQALMEPKLMSRAQQQGKRLTPYVLHDIRIRASHAWEEILTGRDYDEIILNHDTEDSPHWQSTPPQGEAGAALERFVHIITATNS